MSSGPRSAYACLLPIAWTSLDESFWLVELHRFVNHYTRIYFDDEGARTARSVAWMRACKRQRGGFLQRMKWERRGRSVAPTTRRISSSECPSREHMGCGG
jgi:hypothetical protein